MATIHHQAYHHSTTSHQHRRCLRRHSLDYSSLPTSTNTTSSSSSLKPTTVPSHLTFSLSSTSTPTPTTAATGTTTTTTFSLETLHRHLEAQNFRQADEETRRLLIVLAGEAAIKRGYVFFSEVKFISKDDLKAIDELWKEFSNGRFGYSVQKSIWVKVNKDFTRFFMKVGWMKKLDTEMEQYNYRSFPNEFMWELNPNTNEQEDEEGGGGGGGGENNKGIPPEGHLPLTNALRGTQLLNSILTHPAFAATDDDDDDDEKNGDEGRENEQSVSVEADKKKSRFASLRDKLFKPNYSF